MASSMTDRVRGRPGDRYNSVCSARRLGLRSQEVWQCQLGLDTAGIVVADRFARTCLLLAGIVLASLELHRNLQPGEQAINNTIIAIIVALVIFFYLSNSVTDRKQ